MRKIATTTPRRCARQASQRLRTFRDYVSFGSKADISRYGRWRGAEVPPPFLQRRINRRYANQRCGHSSATLGPRRGRLGSAWDTPPNSRIRGPKPLPTSNSNNILESLERLGVFAPRSGHRFDPANALALFNFVNSAHKFAHASALGDALAALARGLRKRISDPLACDGWRTTFTNFCLDKIAIRFRCGGTSAGYIISKQSRILLPRAPKGGGPRYAVAPGDFIDHRFEAMRVVGLDSLVGERWVQRLGGVVLARFPPPWVVCSFSHHFAYRFWLWLLFLADAAFQPVNVSLKFGDLGRQPGAWTSSFCLPPSKAKVGSRALGATSNSPLASE
jgi:hypothetical protein